MLHVDRGCPARSMSDLGTASAQNAPMISASRGRCRAAGQRHRGVLVDAGPAMPGSNRRAAQPRRDGPGSPAAPDRAVPGWRARCGVLPGTGQTGRISGRQLQASEASQACPSLFFPFCVLTTTKRCFRWHAMSRDCLRDHPEGGGAGYWREPGTRAPGQIVWCREFPARRPPGGANPRSRLSAGPFRMLVNICCKAGRHDRERR